MRGFIYKCLGVECLIQKMHWVPCPAHFPPVLYAAQFSEMFRLSQQIEQMEEEAEQADEDGEVRSVKK